MSQRDSGYQRKERDLYETPEWVTEALLPHIPGYVQKIWEPAASTGRMANVLKKHSDVIQSDIYKDENLDFVHDFECDLPDMLEFDAIITNPPYNIALPFIELSLERTKKSRGFVAMLLRTDYDHAKTRQHIFGECAAFSSKIVLTKRIIWFDGGASPSFNHAWFTWDWCHRGDPKIKYFAC